MRPRELGDRGGRWRQTLAASIGNLLEWYDFALFGLTAAVFSEQFFPTHDGGAGLIRVFATFAAGFLARPLGWIFFGWVGDRFGRRRSLTLSIWLMVIPTLGIGLLPGVDVLGIWATALLIVLRVIQGLSVGGEWVSSMIFLVESSESHRQGFRSSFGLVTISLGLALGSGVVLLVHSSFGDGGWQSWAWRIPYLLGGVLAFFGVWVRRVIRESPAFVELAESDRRAAHPIHAAIRSVPRRIALMMGAVGISTVTFTVFFIWAPGYAQSHLGLDARSAMLANTAGLVTLAVLTPFGGWLSDVVGYKRLYVGVVAALTAAMVPGIALLDSGTLAGAMLAQMGVGALLGLLQPSVVLARLFPVALRTSAMGLGYNVPQAFLGGLAPLVCSGLVQRTGEPLSPALFLLAVGIVSSVSAWRLPQSPPQDRG